MALEKKINRKDIEWIMFQVACCLGISVVFIPIQAAIAGIGPLIISVILVFPVMYISHRNISMIVAEDQTKSDITFIFKNRLGLYYGLLASFVYFLTCFGVALGFSSILPKAINNALNVFDIIHNDYSNNWIFILITLLIPFISIISNKKLMLKIVVIMAYPLIIMFLLIAFFLIPKWNISNLYEPTTSLNWIKGICLLFPMFIFGMNYCQAISHMVVYYKNTEKSIEDIKFKVRRNVFISSLIIIIFVSFFTFSCDLAFTLNDAVHAINKNISVLTLIGDIHNLTFLIYISPFITIFGIICALAGCYLGCVEATIGVMLQIKQYYFSNVKINNYVFRI
jgi:serine transporter